MTIHTTEFPLGDRTITLETGRIARQADAAIVLRERRTMLLATVVADQEPSLKPFLPLTVEYREKTAANGRIPGNFFRRETRMGDHEVLTSRLIDRSLRPLFAKDFHAATTVTVTVYSAEPDANLEGLALIAAGAALHISDLPFAGPVAGVQLVQQSNTPALLPSAAQIKTARAEITLAAGPEGLVMLEGAADELSESEILSLIDFAQAALTPAFEAMDTLRQAVAPRTRTYASSTSAWTAPEGLVDQIAGAITTPDRRTRQAQLRALKSSVQSEHQVDFDALVAQVVRQRTLSGFRIGGRGPTEIRPIECETGTLPANHGSAMFTRGETQALLSTTLGGQRDARDMDTLFGHSRQRFMLHYNFPGFAVGDTRPSRGPGRRELGHGHLARRALLPVMPSTGYPYTIRVVSDITEANGSSSMATVCGAALALRSAGVPIQKPVGGIAMGLIQDAEKTVILSDILGDEDHFGDMDFKIAGTADGITAIQLDNKRGTLSRAVIETAFNQGREGLTHILSIMEPVWSALDGQPPEHAPHHQVLKINPARVGQLIGTGGRNLNQLQGRTRAKIEVANDGSGRVTIMGPNAESTAAAVQAVRAISIELVKGGLYMATVTNLKEFGAFVRIADHEGLVHISELGDAGVSHPSEAVQPEQEILIRVIGTDKKGRLKLSQKAAAGANKAEALNR